MLLDTMMFITRRLFCNRTRDRSDISSNERIFLTDVEHLEQQGRRGRFSVRSGNCNDWGLT